MPTKACFNCSAVTVTDGAFCPACGTQYGAGAEVQGQGATRAPKSSSTLAVSIPLMIASVLGCIAPFLEYYVFDGLGASGWDSRYATEYYDLYSQGPTVTMVLSIVTLAVGAVLTVMGTSKTSQVTTGTRITFGVTALAAGGILAINSGLVYNAIDEAAQLDGVFVEVGLGWTLSLLTAFVIAIAGVLILAFRFISSPK